MATASFTNGSDAILFLNHQLVIGGMKKRTNTFSLLCLRTCNGSETAVHRVTSAVGLFIGLYSNRQAVKMPPNSNEPDESEQDRRLGELGLRLKIEHDEEGFLNDKYNLLRYLRGYDWDVNIAHQKLQATLQWRRKLRPWETSCKYCDNKPGFHSWRQVGIDKQGRPVVYSSFVQATGSFTAEDNVQHTLYLMENAKRCMRPEEYTWVWVLDCSGLTMAACNPMLARAVNHVVAEHYPERMGLVIVVNHGIVFEGIWRGMRLFIHPRTASKLRLCRGDKVATTFQELFPADLCVWFLKELELNAQRMVSPAQLQFWRKPADSDVHDPRGCPSYVSQYIDKYYKEVVVPQANENVEKPEACMIHKPHSNIIQVLKEEAMLEVQNN